MKLKESVHQKIPFNWWNWLNLDQIQRVMEQISILFFMFCQYPLKYISLWVWTGIYQVYKSFETFKGIILCFYRIFVFFWHACIKIGWRCLFKPIWHRFRTHLVVPCLPISLCEGDLWIIMKYPYSLPQ